MSKAIRFDGNTAVIAAPKTEAGRRNIPLFDILANALRGHEGYIVESAHDCICTECAWKRGWQSYMNALSEAAGREVKIRPHDLRHSYCTMLRDAGVEMKLAMQWMGHADEKMILRTYDHINADRVEKAVESVEKMGFERQNERQNNLEACKTLANKGLRAL